MQDGFIRGALFQGVDFILIDAYLSRDVLRMVDRFANHWEVLRLRGILLLVPLRIFDSTSGRFRSIKTLSSFICFESVDLIRARLVHWSFLHLKQVIFSIFC